MTELFIGCAVVGLAAFLWAMAIYNTLISFRNEAQNAWAQIDVQLQRRYDLIPNLVESVKAYMSHEKTTFETIAQMRNQASSSLKKIEAAGIPTDKALMTQLNNSEMALQDAVSKIFALAENYPDLKASANMQKLQEELASTENKVSFARQAYNDQVLRYNNAQQYFPAVLLAANFGHRIATNYEVSNECVKENVQVKF